MRENRICVGMIRQFREQLQRDERSAGTIEKYGRDVEQFCSWLGERAVTKELVTQWKGELIDQGYQPSTINGKLASVNRFFRLRGWEEYCVKALRLQRRVFREQSRELTKEEYEKLLRTASRQGKERLELLMETICATGIRVSEVKYITVEAIIDRRAEVALKGKIREILLPAKLCRKLSKYAKKCGIRSGEIFLGRNGISLSRKQIWSDMKRLCVEAGVEPTKVFPHNLRHLFARCFYRISHDLVRLADVLGHSSVETTRIYLKSTGEEHARTLARMKLVS